MYKKLSVFIAACIGMAFFGIAFIVMGSVLPALSAKYALTSLEAASLVTFLPIGVLLGSLIFGPIVDRYGYRILMVASIIFTVVGLEGLSFLNNMHLLRVSIFLIGFGGGMLNGSTNALVSEISNDHTRSARLSILGACYGVGALLIPVLLGILSRYCSYETILTGSGIFMLLSTVYFLTIRFPKPLNPQQVPIRVMLKLIRQPILLIFSLFLFFQSGLEGLFNNWTTTYLTETVYNIHTEDIVFILTFFILGMTITRLLLSKILEYTLHFMVLLVSIVLAAGGVIGLMLAKSFIGIAVSVFICGCGLAAGFPVMVALIGSVYHYIPGTAIGFSLFIALSGNSILNYLTGLWTHRFGISVFPLSLIILLLLQVVIILTNKKIINTHS